MAFKTKLFAAGGYNTTFFGPGRKEFSKEGPFPSFETYLQEAVAGVVKTLQTSQFDEGIVGSFMSARFLDQGHLAAFLPSLLPSLSQKPCLAVEGACATGGKAMTTAIKTLLSGVADVVFVLGFEVQNRVKAVYGADILAGAAYYQQMRKSGYAHFFPGLFDRRVQAYGEVYGQERVRRGCAKWYEQAIVKARTCPKAQEYANTNPDLFQAALAKPNPERFLPHLTPLDCSKVSDGASAIVLMTEKGKERLQPEACVEIVSYAELQGDITRPPEDLTELETSKRGIESVLAQSGWVIEDVDIVEVHDCFTITGLLFLEALGVAEKGEAPDVVGKEPFVVNASGGLVGFGHPTGATGVRQLVDLTDALTGRHVASVTGSRGLMVNMGGDDKTAVAITVQSCS